MIRTNSTTFRSILSFNSRLVSSRLKSMYSVISVILDLLPANTGARQVKGLQPRSQPRAIGVGPEFPLFFLGFYHFSLRSDVSHFIFLRSDIVIEVRSQNEEMSDFKNAGKIRGKKDSLKARQEKIMNINPWGLWSNHYGARRLEG